MIIWRRQVITHKSVQLRLASLFISSIIIYIALLAALFFYIYVTISTNAGVLTIHDQLLTRMLLIDLSKKLALIFGLVTAVYVLLMAIYIIVYSHRMTGPIHKMNLLLDQAVEKKEWPKKVKFRKTDAFAEFAIHFNKFCDAMKEVNEKKQS